MLPIIKSIGAPGSIKLLLICTAIGLAILYIWPRNVRLGRMWLLGLFTLYFVLALPWTAKWISRPLSADPVPHSSALKPITTLIVLDGDNRRGRVREAARVHRAAASPAVLVIGNKWMLDPLLQAGIPWARIRHDVDVANTRAQMARVKHLAAGLPAGTVGVIASRLQMRRVAALARATRLNVVLIPSEIDDEPPTSGVRILVPAYIALRVSRDALYEHAALAYYRWKRWI